MTPLPRVWRITLIVSLLANVLLIAALVTASYRHDHDGPRGHVKFGLLPSPRAIDRGMREDERAMFRTILDAHRGEVRGTWRGMHDARGRIDAALRAEPFDRARLDAAFAELRRHGTRTADHVQDAIGDFAEKLDADGRARLADALKHRRHMSQDKRRLRRDDARRHRANDGKPVAAEAAPTPLARPM